MPCYKENSITVVAMATKEDGLQYFFCIAWNVNVMVIHKRIIFYTDRCVQAVGSEAWAGSAMYWSGWGFSGYSCGNCNTTTNASLTNCCDSCVCVQINSHEHTVLTRVLVWKHNMMLMKNEPHYIRFDHDLHPIISK